MRPDVLVLRETRPDGMRQLAEAYTLHSHEQAQDPDALLREVGPRIRAIVTTGERGASGELIDSLPNLEIVGCFGVGIDAIDREACRRRGIPITNTPDVLTDDVADMGLALMLAVLRRIVEADGWLRGGNWQEASKKPISTTLRGKTLGILGLGRIGKALARRAEACGMSIAYTGRQAQQDVPYAFHASLVELARHVDVLALSCPGGPATRGLVTAEVLEALGPEGYLVNIARGSVVDEPALVSALVEGRIKGAGLDVFADEPHVPQALIDMPQVVLQPHSASATNETRDAMAQLVVDNLAAHFAGRPLLTPT